MESNKKCSDCGEILTETVYAADKKESENADPGNIVIQCENYENCPQHNKKLEA